MTGFEHTACNLCGADSPRHLYRKFDLDIVRCTSCGLVYAGPQRVTPEVSWQRYSDDYFWKEYMPSLGIQDGQFDLNAFDAHYNKVLNLIDDYRGNGRFLDVGCGAGFFLKAAERRGWQHVVGLEVSDAAVAFMRDRLQIDVRPCTIEDAGFDADYFDVVAMVETIEHLFDPFQVLRDAYRCLRPGGLVMMTTPNFNALSRLFLGVNWSVLSPGEHLYYFTERTLMAMLRKVGFTNIASGRYFADQDMCQTMCPYQSHAPDGWRVKLYSRLVKRFGPAGIRYIQGCGCSDHLVMLAEKPGRAIGTTDAHR